MLPAKHMRPTRDLARELDIEDLGIENLDVPARQTSEDILLAACSGIVFI